MIEIVIKKYLDGHLSVPSFFEHEINMPQEFVILEKTRGAKKNHAKTATFAFQSYSTSMQKAAELNEKLKQVIENMVELNEIGGIHLNSDYNFTDTETKKYRYQAVFDINYF